MDGFTNAVSSGASAVYTITAIAGVGGTISVPATVPKGGSATATITPNPTYNIQEVTVNGVSQGPVSTFQFTNVRENQTISATFTQITHHIEVTQPTNGTITPGNGEYAEGGTHIFHFTPNEGYKPKTVTWNGTTSVYPLEEYTTEPLMADATLTCEFEKKTFRVQTSKTGAGNGSISPLGDTDVEYGQPFVATITLTAGCILNYLKDNDVDVTSQIVPVTGETFKYTYTIAEVKEIHNLVIDFEGVVKTITATSGSHGSIDPSGEVEVVYNGNKRFYVTSDTGYEVDALTVDGTAATLTGPNYYDFTNVIENHTINVTFKKQTFTVTCTQGGSASAGSIDPTGSFQKEFDDTMVFTVTLASGVILSSLTDNGTDVTGQLVPVTGEPFKSTYTITGIRESHVVLCNFEGRVCTVDVTHGENGTTDPTGEIEIAYNTGIRVITLLPATGYEVDKITYEGVEQPYTPGATTFTLSNVTSETTTTLNVTFKKKKYLVTPLVSGSGTISPSTQQEVEYQSSISFTVTPTAGATLLSLLDNGVEKKSALVGNVYTIASVEEAHTISAQFTTVYHNIEASASSNCSINPSGTIQVEHNTNKTFNFTFDTGYELNELKINGVVTTPTSATEYTFVNVTADATINISAKKKKYLITIEKDSGVTTTPAASTEVEYGNSLTVQYAPAEAKYKLTSVKVDDVTQTIGTEYVFTNVSAPHKISIASAIKTFEIEPRATGNGAITPNTRQTYNYGDTPTYYFTPVTHYKVSKLEINGTEISPAPQDEYTFPALTSDQLIVVTFAEKMVTITPTKSGTGIGTITPATVTKQEGQSQTFTFTADASSDITKVTVNGTALPSVVTEYEFTSIAEGDTLDVEFTKKTFSMTGDVHTADTGTIDPTSQTVEYGTNLTYTFTPATGFQVNAIDDNGTITTPYTSTTYTVTNITEDHYVVVDFALIPFTITATANPSTAGTVSPATQSVSYNHDSTAITITANTGYHITDVVADGTTHLGAVTTYTFTNVKADHSLEAQFAIDTHTFTATAGTGGTITSGGSQTVNYDGSATVTVTPNVGYKVKSYTRPGVGDVAITTNTFTVEHILADTAITVNFEQISYSLTATSGDNGTIVPTSVSKHYGESQTFTMTPSTNYMLNTFTVDGSAETPTKVGDHWEFEIEDIDANYVLHVTWKLKPKITSSTGDHGDVSPVGDTYVEYNTNQTYTFTAESNDYTIDTVKLDGSAVTPTYSTTNTWTYTVANVVADHTIHVTWKNNTHTVTATSGANGSISPTSATVTHGGSQVLTMTANSGYTLDAFTVDGTAKTPTLSSEGVWTYTITNITANVSANVTWKVVPVIEFTVLDNSDPTTGFTYPSGYTTEAARTAYLQSHCHPALVADDGTVSHWMTWTDMTHDKTSGDAVTIDGTAGSVFALWDCAWYKAESVSGGMKYSFTFATSSPGTGYTCIADMGTKVGSYAGMGVFGAVKNSSNQIVSGNLSSNPTVSQTQNTFYTQAIASRTGMFNQNFPPLVAFYKMMLLFEKGNKNTQAAYGNGMSSTSIGAVNKDWSSTSAWNNGDTSVKTKGVTALGVHNFWGNVYEFMGEMKCGATAGKIGFSTKWNDHQNIETAGYPSTWHEVNAGTFSSGYIKSMASDSVDPFIPSATGGSATTYYCDYGYSADSTERCVYVGGYYSSDDYCGAFYWYGSDSVSYSDAYRGSRLAVVVE